MSQIGRCRLSFALSLFGLLSILLLVGCQDSAVIWSAKSLSPDGHWLASARTDQYGGPGTASVQTTVYLKWLNGTQPPVQILEFTNASAYPSGSTTVAMNWRSQTHLEVTYNGNATLNFQAVKCGNITISVRDISSSSKE